MVSGGGGISTMGELARSVRAHGGHTTGVIPQQLLDWEVGDTDSDELIVPRDKPVVVLDPWGDFHDLRALVDGLLERRMVRQQAADDVRWATSIPEALDLIEVAWAAGEGRGAQSGPQTGHPEEWLEAD